MSYARGIRGNFIRDYAEQNERMWNTGSELVVNRDKLHQALNMNFGYSEPDGSYGAGCKSYTNQKYKTEYDEIEARFRKPYDDGLPSLQRWCQLNEMSIYEFLFLDNIDSDHLRLIAADTQRRADWELQPIQKKAKLLVHKLKGNHYVGELRRRIDLEISHQTYARYRCRNFFKIKPWSVGDQMTMFSYGSEWKRALDSAFSRLTAS